MQVTLGIDTVSPERRLVLLSQNGKRYEVTVDEALPESTGQDLRLDAIGEAVRGLPSGWAQSGLVIDLPDTPTTSLALPFTDSKRLNQILPVELQDTLPFIPPGDLFLRQSTPIKDDIGNSVINVTAVDRNLVKIAVDTCRRQNFEPNIIAPPKGVLSALLDIAPEYFAGTIAIIWLSENCKILTVSIQGRAIFERELKLITNEDKRIDERRLAREVRLCLASLEHQHRIAIEKVHCFVNSQIQVDVFEGMLGRKVMPAHISEFVDQGTDQNGLAILAALAPLATKQQLLNLRVEEFSHRPQLREFVAIGRALKPYILGAAIAILLSVVALFGIRQYQLVQLKKATYDIATATLGGGSVSSGGELVTLASEIAKLEERLRELGSLSDLSPIDALQEFSTLYSSFGGEVTVTAFSVRDGKARIKGAVANYATVDKIEQMLGAKKNIFCDLSVKESPGQGEKSVNFDLTFVPCS